MITVDADKVYIPINWVRVVEFICNKNEASINNHIPTVFEIWIMKDIPTKVNRMGDDKQAGIKHLIGLVNVQASLSNYYHVSPLNSTISPTIALMNSSSSSRDVEITPIKVTSMLPSALVLNKESHIINSNLTNYFVTSEFTSVSLSELNNLLEIALRRFEPIEYFSTHHDSRTQTQKISELISTALNYTSVPVHDDTVQEGFINSKQHAEVVDERESAHSINSHMSSVEFSSSSDVSVPEIQSDYESITQQPKPDPNPTLSRSVASAHNSSNVHLLNFAVVNECLNWSMFDAAMLGTRGIDYSDLGCFVSLPLPSFSAGPVGTGSHETGLTHHYLWWDSGYVVLNGRSKVRYELPKEQSLADVFRIENERFVGHFDSDSVCEEGLLLQLYHCDDDGARLHHRSDDDDSGRNLIFATTTLPWKQLHRLFETGGGSCVLSLPLFVCHPNSQATMSSSSAMLKLSVTYVLEPLSPCPATRQVVSAVKPIDGIDDSAKKANHDSGAEQFPVLLALLRQHMTNGSGSRWQSANRRSSELRASSNQSLLHSPVSSAKLMHMSGQVRDSDQQTQATSSSDEPLSVLLPPSVSPEHVLLDVCVEQISHLTHHSLPVSTCNGTTSSSSSSKRFCDTRGTSSKMYCLIAMTVGKSQQPSDISLVNHAALGDSFLTSLLPLASDGEWSESGVVDTTVVMAESPSRPMSNLRDCHLTVTLYSRDIDLLTHASLTRMSQEIRSSSSSLSEAADDIPQTVPMVSSGLCKTVTGTEPRLTDQIIGRAVVDVSLLSLGVKQVEGWYNIVDSLHNACGQIKLSVKPICKYEPTGQSDNSIFQSNTQHTSPLTQALTTPLQMNDLVYESTNLPTESTSFLLSSIHETLEALQQTLVPSKSPDHDTSNKTTLNFSEQLQTAENLTATYVHVAESSDDSFPRGMRSDDLSPVGARGGHEDVITDSSAEESDEYLDDSFDTCSPSPPAAAATSHQHHPVELSAEGFSSDSDDIISRSGEEYSFSFPEYSSPGKHMVQNATNESFNTSANTQCNNANSWYADGFDDEVVTHEVEHGSLDIASDDQVINGDEPLCHSAGYYGGGFAEEECTGEISHSAVSIYLQLRNDILCEGTGVNDTADVLTEFAPEGVAEQRTETEEPMQPFVDNGEYLADSGSHPSSSYRFSTYRSEDSEASCLFEQHTTDNFNNDISNQITPRNCEPNSQGSPVMLDTTTFRLGSNLEDISVMQSPLTNEPLANHAKIHFSTQELPQEDEIYTEFSCMNTSQQQVGHSPLQPSQRQSMSPSPLPQAPCRPYTSPRHIYDDRSVFVDDDIRDFERNHSVENVQPPKSLSVDSSYTEEMRSLEQTNADEHMDVYPSSGSDGVFDWSVYRVSATEDCSDSIIHSSLMEKLSSSLVNDVNNCSSQVRVLTEESTGADTVRNYTGETAAVSNAWSSSLAPVVHVVEDDRSLDDTNGSNQDVSLASAPAVTCNVTSSPTSTTLSNIEPPQSLANDAASSVHGMRASWTADRVQAWEQEAVTGVRSASGLRESVMPAESIVKLEVPAGQSARKQPSDVARLVTCTLSRYRVQHKSVSTPSTDHSFAWRQRYRTFVEQEAERVSTLMMSTWSRTLASPG